MNRTSVICDVENCGKPDAERLSFFKERKSDGAGGMEDWFYVFDLCPRHVRVMLSNILQNRSLLMLDGLKLNNIKAIIEGLKINTRVE
jgi:hypothetical protein